ncbi:MAG: DNRLRE domain-containing protein, partial [Planctomycetota bacterium]|nr:DNRLRE domain-containing protein [Planctomycetota bacterium]
MPLSCLAAIALVPGSGASADEVVLAPFNDNTLFETMDGSTSNGAGNAVFSGKTGFLGGGVKLRAVLAFDVVGDIPAGSTITSANLTLVLVQASIFGGVYTHTLHRILADWGEGTSVASGGGGALSTPGDATWLHTFFPDQFWTNQGGDFDPIVSASQSVGTCSGPCVPVVPHTWASTPQMVADVQGWLDDPPTNFGWLLMGNEDASNSAKRFASREFVNPKHRPMLTVEFSPPPFSTADITGPRGVSDGCVDAFDLGAMLGAWCSGINDPNPPSPPCENCTPVNLAIADISGAANLPDGCVDAFDLAKL